jgi:predicted DsbA family dithiol-disulfide isomerase
MCKEIGGACEKRGGESSGEVRLTSGLVRKPIEDPERGRSEPHGEPRRGRRFFEDERKPVPEQLLRCFRNIFAPLSVCTGTRTMTLLTSRSHGVSGPKRVWHWYDFTCPSCYLGQNRNAILRRNGLHLELFPFSVRTASPGSFSQRRETLTHRFLERAAHGAGLALRWPVQVPNARTALCVAEWVRQYQPDLFQPLYERVFAAHFALGEDIGDGELIYGLAESIGVDVASVRVALANGSAEAALVASESAAHRLGVIGPPAWLIGDRLMAGWSTLAEFEKAVQRQLRIVLKMDGTGSR